MKILIIGGGNMGSAIARALINHGQVILEKLMVCERDRKKWPYFKELGRELEVEVTEKLNPKIVGQAEVIILAVKPQDLTPLLWNLKSFLKKQLVISIAAGVTLKNLNKNLGTDVLVRVMPNSPALIGEGISGWILDRGVSPKQKEIARLILQSFGQEIEFKKEADLDVVTALSGSGPAYVFYFLESLIEGTKELGLAEKTAKKLALQTFLGAAKLASVSGDSLEVLRQRVTSKGGTTEAALQVFEKEKLKGIIKKALKKALKRAKELNS